MEEYGEVEENPKNEKIIQENDEKIKEKNTLDINKIIKERNKYNNISYEENNNNNKKCYNIKEKLKIIFCPCYCLFYKSFEWIWDGRCSLETYYKSHYFFENIFFCVLSIIDIVAISFYKNKFTASFFIIRIISDSFGIFIFWLSIVLWDEESSYKDYFKLGLLFTLLGLILMSVLDIFCFVTFCASNSDFNVVVLLSFLIHLILSIAFFSFNLCKFIY